MKKNLFVIIIFFALQQFQLFAQDQDPTNTNWKKIETDHFRMIFNENISDTAIYLANMLEQVYLPVNKTLNSNPRKTHLIIHNQSTTSNGYAALFPKKMAWYTTPMQDVNLLGTTNWLNTLAVHEYRHICQYAKNNQKFTKFGSIFYGQMAQAGLRWSIPKWFFEGDAVNTETALTRGGRGRMAGFDMPLRTILLENQQFSYEEATLGTYNRFFPDYYVLGYHLGAYIRTQNKANIWSDVLDHTAKISWYPFAFSRALKRNTGKNVKQTYIEATSKQKHEWIAQFKGMKISEVDTVIKAPEKHFIHYKKPQFLNDSTLIAIKSGLDYAPVLVKINMADGKETRLRYIYTDNLDAQSNFVVWEQTKIHPRWDEASFSDLMLYNVTLKTLKRITYRKKFFAPALAPNKTRIAAVEYSDKLKSTLVFLYVSNGVVYDSLSIQNQNIMLPSWSADGKQIVFTHGGIDGISLSIYNTENKTVNTLISNTFEDISHPQFYKKYILYQSSVGGINNIFAIDIQTKEKFRISSSKYGAFEPTISPDQQTMVYQDYTINGYCLVKTKMDKNNWKPVNAIKDRSLHLYKPLVDQEQGESVFTKYQTPKKQYEIEKYNRLFNSVKINYWGIYANDTELLATVSSTNELNTLAFSAVAAYNPLNNIRRYAVSAQFSRWYPIINIRWQDRERKQSYLIEDIEHQDHWYENSIDAEISIPYNFSFGSWYSKLNFTPVFSHAHLYGKQTNYRYFMELGFEKLVSTGFNLEFSNFAYSSKKAVQSRWGQQLFVYHRQNINTDEYQGNQWGGILHTYWPGIMRSHGIRVSVMFEDQIKLSSEITNPYFYPSYIALSRGHEQIMHEKVRKISLNYKLPLFYPNLEVGSLMFIKRLKANVFYDSTVGSFYTSDYLYSSFGTELTMDFAPFQIMQDIELGVRISHNIQQNKQFYELILAGLAF